jgi:hypothetical protein
MVGDCGAEGRMQTCGSAGSDPKFAFRLCRGVEEDAVPARKLKADSCSSHNGSARQSRRRKPGRVLRVCISRTRVPQTCAWVCVCCTAAFAAAALQHVQLHQHTEQGKLVVPHCMIILSWRPYLHTVHAHRRWLCSNHICTEYLLILQTHNRYTALADQQTKTTGMPNAH